jgi:hypothetical protein
MKTLYSHLAQAFAFAFAFAFALTLACALPQPAYAGKKDEKPDWIEFRVLRKGKPAGDFHFKTVTSASGKIYTSSKLNLKTRKGVLTIRGHVERHPSGRLEKYKKWVGKKGHSPKLIAWWLKGKLRVVSKVKKHRFTRDVSPPDEFALLDRLGFHLYADLAGLWKVKGALETPVLLLHKGKMDTLSLSDGGTAILKNKVGEELKVRVVSVTSKGVTLSLFVGDKPTYLGFQSATLMLLREGYSFVAANPDDKLEAAPAEELGAAPVEIQPEQPTEAPVENPAEDPSAAPAEQPVAPPVEQPAEQKKEEKEEKKNEEKAERLPDLPE